MANPPITIVIEGRAYKLQRGNIEAYRKIETSHRQQLIALLDSIKALDSSSASKEPKPQVRATGSPAPAARLSTVQSAQVRPSKARTNREGSTENRAGMTDAPVAPVAPMAPGDRSGIERASDHLKSRPVKMGRGDIDAATARLIEAERNKQKPVTTKWAIYKYLAIFLVIVILLVLIS